jgi:YidC/Oxa1 family membrane protein insertase
VAIVLLTVAVRVLLLPLAVTQARSVWAQRALRPELDKLQARYGKRPE